MTVKIFDFSGIWRAVFKIRFRKENMLHPQEAVNTTKTPKYTPVISIVMNIYLFMHVIKK